MALGDEYHASVSHDLSKGVLHVSLTSSSRHHFEIRDIQVSPQVVRMINSYINNISIYGVRFIVTLDLLGNGNYQLVLSYPVVSGKKTFYFISWLDADRTSKFIKRKPCWVVFWGKFGSYGYQSFRGSRLTRQSHTRVSSGCHPWPFTECRSG